MLYKIQPEMAISTNQKPTIYRNLYENTGPGIDYILNQNKENLCLHIFVVLMLVQCRIGLRWPNFKNLLGYVNRLAINMINDIGPRPNDQHPILAGSDRCYPHHNVFFKEHAQV